jgi:hypothetical protein
MLKPVIAAAAVLAIGGSSIVYAQQRFGEHNGFGHWGARAEHHHRPSAADMAAFTDARIAALKAGLELTPDQQKNWPAFEQALRDVAQLRVQRAEARQARQARMQQGATPQQDATPQQGQSPNGPFDPMARRADGLAKTGTALKKLADSGAPLYQSLTDEQKARFKTLSHMLRPHHPHNRFAFNDRDGGWRQGGRGMGQGGDPGSGGWHRHFGPGGGGNGNGQDNDGGSGSKL